jgi:hypothetical protein
VATELAVLQTVSEHLSAHGLPFMLTGSFALAYYATPCMTRDLDLVVALEARDVEPLVSDFEADFYIDADAVREAVRSQHLLNLMHLESGIEVDMIVRKASEYRQVEVARRKPVSLAGVDTWIVSREDLVLSKLAGARDSSSEMQLRDVRLLVGEPLDTNYLAGLGDQPRRRGAAREGNGVTDTSPQIQVMVAERHREMSAAER